MSEEIESKVAYERAVDLLATSRELFNDILREVAVAEAGRRSAQEVCGTREKQRTWRNALDDAARIRYERDGDVKFEIRDGQVRIGSYTVRVNKGADEETVSHLEAGNEDIVAFLLGDGSYLLDRLVAEHRREVLDWALADGIVFDGARVVEFTRPAHPETFRDTALSIKYDEIVEHTGRVSAHSIAGLLEG